MKTFNLTGLWIASICLLFSVLTHRAEATLPDIARKTMVLGESYGLQIPVVLAHSQRPTLGPVFLEQFKIVGDLTGEALKKYISAFPEEFWATEGYLQYLYRTHYIDPERLQMLRGAIVAGMEIGIATTAPLPLLSQLSEERTISKSDLKDRSPTPELDRATQLFQAAMRGEDLEQLATDEIVEKTEKLLETEGRGRLLDLFDNAKISITGIEGRNPEFEIGVVSTLADINTDSIFQQTSVGGYDGRTTLNVGLGGRSLSADKFWLFGLNTFYDHEFPYDHQRASVGVEIKSSPIMFSANKYFGLSGYKVDRDGAEAKPVDGYDGRLRVALPYMPGLHALYNVTKWKGEDGAEDVNVKTYGLKGRLSENFSLRYAHDNYSDSQDDKNSLNLEYSWSPSQKSAPTIFEIADSPWNFESMEDHLVDFVERENRIIKQRRFEVRIITE